MKNVADSIVLNWEWLKGRLGSDWDQFLADCQIAVDHFNCNQNLSSFERIILNSLSQTRKVDAFLEGMKMGTTEASPQTEDSVKNEVDKLAQRVEQELGRTHHFFDLESAI